MNMDNIDDKVIQTEFDFVKTVELKQRNQFMLRKAHEHYDVYKYSEPYKGLSFDDFLIDYYLPVLHRRDHEEFKRLYRRNTST